MRTNEIPCLPRAEPCPIDSGGRLLFGWYHCTAQRPKSRLQGIVLCLPFGEEAIRAHRTYRHLAERLAEAGFPVMRFDYYATGDSLGEGHCEDRPGTWIDDVVAAADALRKCSGLEKVGLFGFRLGATIAACTACQGSAVDTLVLWDPCVSGKSFIRELRLQAILIPNGTVDQSSESNGGNPFGYSLTRDFLEFLETLDLLRLKEAPASSVLIVGSGTPEQERIAVHLTALGADVRQQRVTGPTGIDTDPHCSVIREDVINALVDYWNERCPEVAPVCQAMTQPVSGWRVRDSQRGFTEEALFFGSDARLFGVLTQPAMKVASPFAVLLLNAGCVHHIGPHRLYVTLARQWAGLGLATFRLDLSGIGDSQADPTSEENLYYPPGLERDVQEAISAIEASRPITRFVLAGICSGAFTSLHMASRDPRVTGAILINLDARGDREAAQTHANIEYYRRAALRLSSWKKLLIGRVAWPAIGKALFSMIRRMTVGAAHGLFPGRPGLLSGSSQLAADFTRMADRVVDVLLVYSKNDPQLAQLKSECGEELAILTNRLGLRIVVVEGADHTFTRAQASLESLLTEDLMRRVLETTKRNTP